MSILASSRLIIKLKVDSVSFIFFLTMTWYVDGFVRGAQVMQGLLLLALLLTFQPQSGRILYSCPRGDGSISYEVKFPFKTIVIETRRSCLSPQIFTDVIDTNFSAAVDFFAIILLISITYGILSLCVAVHYDIGNEFAVHH